jgi:sulfite dehydrogenase (cytochrome) subunit B
MRRIVLSISLCAAAQAIAPALPAAPVTYNPPPETATLRPGPGVETANANCGVCHSVDYINTQPRDAGFGREFWQAEVTKMIKTYGAPIQEDDAKVIVDYLAGAYGQPVSR